jgi:NAD(P)H-dependent FMN reductase
MANDQIQLAVIVGSVRTGRIAPVVAGWLLSQLSRHGQISTDVIDLADLDLPANLDGGSDTPVFRKRAEAADAFIIITPEYNHGYPGALKTAIDTAREEWQAKPVGFVSYGGVAGGLRSVEQLRLVFAELHAVTVRQVVSFHWVHDLFDGDGQLRDAGAANAAAQAMLAQLSWWACALRKARAENQYDV